MVEYARAGNTEMILFLWEHGIDVNSTNMLGITPYHVATDIAKKIFEALWCRYT